MKKYTVFAEYVVRNSFCVEASSPEEAQRIVNEEINDDNGIFSFKIDSPEESSFFIHHSLWPVLEEDLELTNDVEEDSECIDDGYQFDYNELVSDCLDEDYFESSFFEEDD